MPTITLLCLAGLMLLVRSPAAQDVNYDYDRRASFSGYQTYAWARCAAATKDLDPGASLEKWEKNINKAVEKMFRHYP